MNRNTFQSGSYTSYPFQNTQKTNMSGFGDSKSRSPLYPIGPTLTQPQFRPIQRPPSPYISRQGMMPPSYQQSHLHQTTSNFNNTNSFSMGKKFDQTKINYEDRQKDIIRRNEIEIQEQHKRRQQMQLSYQRQIMTKTANLARNQQRKQKLMVEVQSLQLNHDELHDKLMGLRPPINKLNTYETYQRKQQEMIIKKNKLLAQIRQRQQELFKEEEEQLNHWEHQFAQKEKILLKLETEQSNRRTELNVQRNQIERPDFQSIQDEIRQERYRDFVYEADEIERKITALTQERIKLSTEIHDSLTLSKPKIYNMNLAHEDLNRQKQQLALRVSDLSRIGKEMQQANDNLMSQLNRRSQMINKYQNDIYELKEKKKEQESSMNRLFSEVRQSSQTQFIPGLGRQISQIQEDIRFQQSNTNRLKTQYQRLYELLCSTTNKNLHQTFNSIYSSDIKV